MAGGLPQGMTQAEYDSTAGTDRPYSGSDPNNWNPEVMPGASAGGELPGVDISTGGFRGQLGRWVEVMSAEERANIYFAFSSWMLFGAYGDGSVSDVQPFAELIRFGYRRDTEAQQYVLDHLEDFQAGGEQWTLDADDMVALARKQNALHTQQGKKQVDRNFVQGNMHERVIAAIGPFIPPEQGGDMTRSAYNWQYEQTMQDLYETVTQTDVQGDMPVPTVDEYGVGQYGWEPTDPNMIAKDIRQYSPGEFEFGFDIVGVGAAVIVGAALLAYAGPALLAPAARGAISLLGKMWGLASPGVQMSIRAASTIGGAYVLHQSVTNQAVSIYNALTDPEQMQADQQSLLKEASDQFASNDAEAKARGDKLNYVTGYSQPKPHPLYIDMADERWQPWSQRSQLEGSSTDPEFEVGAPPPVVEQRPYQPKWTKESVDDQAADLGMNLNVGGNR